MIDFHCHLDLFRDPETVAREAECRGMRLLSVTNTPSAWEHTNTLALSGMWTALGLHPQVAHLRKHELELFSDLIWRTQFVGEIGLDGGSESRSHWHEQLTVFDQLLRVCSRTGGRILSIHSRRAASPVLEALATHEGAGVTILHWFSGNFGELKRALDLGCWFSVGPAMLNGKRGREIVARIPVDRLLTESDAPFARIDGRSTLPWDVGHAMNLLSDIWGLSHKETSETLEENLRRLLKLSGNSSVARSKMESP